MRTFNSVITLILLLFFNFLAYSKEIKEKELEHDKAMLEKKKSEIVKEAKREAAIEVKEAYLKQYDKLADIFKSQNSGNERNKTYDEIIEKMIRGMKG